MGYKELFSFWGNLLLGLWLAATRLTFYVGNWGNLSADMPRVFSVMELCYEDVFK